MIPAPSRYPTALQTDIWFVESLMGLLMLGLICVSLAYLIQYLNKRRQREQSRFDSDNADKR